MNNNITQTQMSKLEKLSQIKRNQITAQKLYSFDEKLLGRICECGHNIALEKYQHIETKEVLQKVTQARTCHLRFCSLCNYYRIRNLTPQIVRELRQLAQQGKQLIFATFTVQNCRYDELRATIQHMNKSFRRMTLNDGFKNNITHWIRTLEITYKKKNGLAHPHFHCVFAVERDYFKHKNYLKTSDWARLWTRCSKSEKNLIVDVRKVKAKNEKQNDSILSAVAELSKYVTKSSDLKKLDVDDMKIIHAQLARLRFIVTSRNIKLDEDERQKIDQEIWRLIEIIFFQWHRKSKEYRHKKTVSR